MLLGGPTDGWNLAIATMAEERSAISGYVKFDRAAALRRLAADPGPDRDDAQRALGELDAYTNAIKALGVRETIRLLHGQASGPASSIAKVAMNVLLRRTFKATLELTGATRWSPTRIPRLWSRTFTCLPSRSAAELERSS